MSLYEEDYNYLRDFASEVNENFEHKGELKLWDFDFRQGTGKDIKHSLKEKDHLFIYIDLFDNTYAWFDKDNSLVAICANGWDFLLKCQAISYLYISEKYRGYGLSNQIMEFLIKDLNCESLCVAKSNKVAIKLYKKFGFTILESVNKIDEDCYILYLPKIREV